MSQRRIPSLNWLRVFEAAARTESFARAAETLHMSSPAVSQQIRALEAYLARDLFHRAPQRVTLTEAGRSFLPVVQHALGSIETTAAALFGPDGEETIMVQAVTLLAMSWLPSRLRAFEAEHAGLRVDVITGNLLADFRTILPGREPDLQIVFGSVIDFPENATPLFGETLRIVTAPEIATSLKTLDDLCGYPLLEVTAHRSGWHQLLSSTPGIDLRRLSFSMVDMTPLALMMAAQGHGLALARSPASDVMVEQLGLATPALSPSTRGLQGYYMLMPETRPHSRSALRLRDRLLKAGQAITNGRREQIC